MKSILSKIPLVKQTNPCLPVEVAKQHPLRHAIRRALCETTRSRMVPIVALSLVGLATPALGQLGIVELSNLDGSNGFVINGVALGDSADAVSAAGDVNGDGIDDILIGAGGADPNGKNVAGASYVVFGASGVNTGGTVELSSLDGSNGFVLNGVAASDGSGASVSAVGDVNDDGIDDLLIGAPDADPNGSVSGASYVVFGANEIGNSGIAELSDLDGSNGFVLNGVTGGNVEGNREGERSGLPVRAAGDVNGDGVDDILIAARDVSYVVFGTSDLGSGGTMELSSLDGSNGFVLGVTGDDISGRVINTAGDVNGDGFDDLLIGDSSADPNGDNSGAIYVVFGANSVGSDGTVELSSLDGSNGFVLNGVSGRDRSGTTVSAAGDVNDDGVDDFLIGTNVDSSSQFLRTGASYVVFGASGLGASGTVELSALDGSNGFVLIGPEPTINAKDSSAHLVSAAGDVNGDGIDDLLNAAVIREDVNNYDIGTNSYVVFGDSEVGSSGSLKLNELDGSNGFKIDGVPSSFYSNITVSAAGDVNGDGFDDVLLGTTVDSSSADYSGTSYVVFGQRPDDPIIATLDIPVSASSDDAEENTTSGKVYRNSTDLELVDQKAHTQLVGMRFNGLAIPHGATITKAFIQFQTDETYSGTTNLIIHGQATGNALTFVNVNTNISSRAQTNAIVNWAPVPWTTLGEAGIAQQTPDIASIIQEIVRQPEWFSGNSLALFISGSGRHTAESFDGDAAPVLHVEYSLGTGNNRLPLVDAGSEQTATLPDNANDVTLNLDGTVSDDGLPDPSSAVTITWNKVSGPGTVSFGDASAADTTATFDTEGTYVLRLTADDGASSRNDAIIVRINPEGIPTILDVSVAASRDDVEQFTRTRVKPRSSDLELGILDQREKFRFKSVRLRFIGLNIPQDATITNAFIQFQADETDSGITSLMIRGERTDNALPITNGSFLFPGHTGATIDWAPAPWTTVGEAGAAQQTPNIAPIIQDIVERPGWLSGNALVVNISGIGRRTAESFDGDPAGAPVLHVEYQ
ncbi:MAG: hypothetical protein V3U88_07400 [Methylococcales bacterium]